jgi:hypothetical protein
VTRLTSSCQGKVEEMLQHNAGNIIKAFIITTSINTTGLTLPAQNATHASQVSPEKQTNSINTHNSEPRHPAYSPSAVSASAHPDAVVVSSHPDDH